MQAIKNHFLLFLGLSVLAFITVILFITALFLKSTAEIELRIAPTSAIVAIDGKAYQNGTFRIPAGNHTIHIEKDGFTAKEYSFNTDDTSKIYDYLTQTDGSFSWYLNNREDALLLTSIGDYQSDLEAQAYNEKYPIIKQLPFVYAHYDQKYNYTEYRIDGGSFEGCKTDFCLKVTDTTGGNLDIAKQDIINLGFNPDDFQILYEYTPIQNL